MFRGDEEVPSYMFAVDTHQVANGKPSVLEGAVSDGSDFGKFAISAVARAVTSTFNTVPTVANWFGADMQELETDKVLAAFDNDLSAYYLENRETVDVWGDVAAMFVPGMAGIKGINLAQKGLSAIERGSFVGSGIAKSFGTLPSLGRRYADEAAAKIADTGGTFRVLEGNTLKAFAANYGQAAVEGAAFEIAAAATMQNSPLFSEHSYKDVLYNAALGGGLIGGGIIGSVTAAQTYGQLKRASDAVGKLMAPFRSSEGIVEGSDEFVKYLELRKQRANVPLPGENTTDPALIQAQTRSLEKRQRDLSNEMLTSMVKITGGDAELATQLHSSMDKMPDSAVFNAMLDLGSISRLGKITKMEDEMMKAKLAGKESNTVLRYLDTQTGETFETAPVAAGIADRVGNKAEFLREVARRVETQPAVGSAFEPLTAHHLDVEARYYSAFNSVIQPQQNIAGKDLPYLEAAVKQRSHVIVDGVEMDPQTLREYVKKLKLQFADDLADRLEFDPNMNSAIAARLINVDRKALEGGGYRGDLDTHFFAKTEFTADPQYAKVLYKGEAGVDSTVLSGMVYIKQLQEVQEQTNRQAAASVLGENFIERMIPIRSPEILEATTRGAGARAAAMASADYGTLGSKVEAIGKVVNEAKTAAHTHLQEFLTPSMHSVLQDVTAQNEINVLRQAVLSTGEKYILQETNGVRRMVLKKVAEYDAAVAAGKKNVMEPDIPANVPHEIPITSDNAWRFVRDLSEYNGQFLEKQKVVRNAQGRGMGNYDGVVYFPQPSSKEFPYFSFVKPKNPFSQEQTQMIWARTPGDLQRLEATIPSEYMVLRKSDTDAFFKARKEYDADLGMNSREVISDLQRTGVAAPFIPKTDTRELFEEILGHYRTQNDRQIREAVELNYSKEFDQLRKMDADFRGVAGSTKRGSAETSSGSPYETYIKTALDIPRSSYLPVWSELNNLAENTVTKAWNAVKGTWGKAKTEEDIARINQAFDEAGFRGVKDSLTELVNNHPADKRVLSSWVQSANALFSTLILRTDPMNALNNGVGNLVLTGSETAYLTNLIKGKGGEEAAQFLQDLSSVKLPGSEAYIRSPTKLVSRAYGDFFKYLSGDPEALARFQKYEKNGWMPSMMDQLRSSMDSLTLTGKETSGEIQAKIKAASKATGDFLEKASLNRFAESMNRFVAAHIADDISAAGIKYAGLTEGDAQAFINSFVNRTQGNYTASQRPLMFQGPIGQSISLFMTYQFNMMQHIFRHLSNEGGRRNAVTLLGLQNSIYGMNGLPAFNFMNQHLVGNAEGNVTHEDVYSKGLDIPAVGDWLLYGGLSNVTGLGLYSRGDLNPRHLTVVPSTIADIPFVSATTKFFGAMGRAASETAAGGNPVSTFLRGIEHAGISRPLAGLAQTLNGVIRDDDTVYATTSKGHVVYAQDLYSLATLGRIAGARPLDEAITRDAYYRVQVYGGKNSEKIATLGSALRDKINSQSEITDEDVDGFMQRYVAAGGDQGNFVKWYQKQVKDAGKNQVAKLMERGNSSSGRYLQNLMRSLEAEPTSLE